MKSTISQASELVEMYLQAKLVPMLKGSPGIGKSQAVYALAKKYNLKLIDLRLSQCDPVDLMGFPQIVNGRGSYVPMETFPIEGDTVPKGYNGWLLFLDELNASTQAVQVAAYKIILDRMVGQHKLHKNVAIVAAGNLETDNAVVVEMSTALQSRMAHIEVEVNMREFTDWAAANGLDTRISSYLELRPENVYSFKPDHTDHTYACPRTWEFAGRLLKDIPDTSPKFLPALAGVISDGIAMDFQVYCAVFKEIPKISQLVANPAGIMVPEEPSVLWALTGSISEAATLANVDKLMIFVNRMPIEMQAITTRQMARRSPEAYASPAVDKWVAVNANYIY